MRPSLDPAAAPLAPAPGAPNDPARRAARWAGAVQCLLGLAWAVYVVHLPAMLAAAGLDRRWVPWVLLADQAAFVLVDWLAGVHADRMRRLAGRCGGWLVAVTLAASLLLVAMPWAAAGGTGLLLAVTFAWSIGSSVLKAPVVSMLGRAAPGPAQGLAAAFAVTGIGLASAAGAPLAVLLREADPRLPLSVAALALAAAAWLAPRIERSLCALPADTAPFAASPADPASPAGVGRAAVDAGTRPAGTGWLAAAVFAAAAGTQVHAMLVSEPLFRAAGATPTHHWHPLFWIGVAMVAVPATRLARGPRALPAAMTALAAGALALLLAYRAPSLVALAGALLAAGAGWGLALAVAFERAMRVGGPARAGAAVGVVFSALALAAVLRLGLAVAGVAPGPALQFAAVAAWVAAALLCLPAMRARRILGTAVRSH